MKGLFKNPVLAFLSSVKLSAVLMGVIAFASAKATFIENDYGRDGAYSLVYAARWFELVLGLLIINLIFSFFRRWPYRGRRYGFMLVHISIVVILISAGITRYFGYEGVMPIREGQSTDYILSDKPHVQAEIGGETDSYAVRLWQPGPSDHWRKVTLGGRTYELGVTEFWPRFEEVYQEGPGGPAGLQMGVSENGSIVTRTMLAGESGTLGSVDARFLEGSFTGEMSASPFGDLRVHAGDQSCRFPVALPSGESHECGGYRFEIIEFQTSFKVGGPSSSEGPLTNPMVRLQVIDPQGNTGERILFAYHPDFDMGHGGTAADFADLDLLYQVNRGIEFSAGGDTGIQARASFGLEALDMTSQDRTEIAAGEVFPVREQFLYANDANGFSFVPVQLMESVTLAPAHSENANAPAAARIVIRNDSGSEAEAICLKHRPGESVVLGGEQVLLSYGPVVRHLPYSLYLDDFVLQTYPGSDNPATYESWVTLTDRERGIEGQKVHVFMNHPLTHRGSKHFQSSYDPDRKGTVLSVNHDPGKWPTYFGYALITLGFILIIAKDLIWPTKSKGSSGARVKDAAKAASLALLVSLTLGTATGALAQHDPNDGQDHSGHNHAAPTTGFVTLSDPAREMASRLVIQDFRGRMKPLDTMAREMVMKVAKRSKFEGRQPVDQYLSWSTNPNFWWDKPLVAVRFIGLKDLLGVDHSVKHVSPASLFDAQGQYRLADIVEEAHRTPDRERTKVQRKLISFDERFNLLYMTFRGSTLSLYPVPGDDNNTWEIIETVTPKLNPEQSAAYSAAYTALAQGLRSGDNAMIISGLEQTRDLQQQYGAEVLPSKAKVDAELFYNKAHIFSWAMVPFLGAFAIMMILYVWNLFRHKGARLSFRNPFYTLGFSLYVIAFSGQILGYVMRWIASGRAPLSNGHESLLFISLAVALAGLVFEIAFRMGVPSGLGALLTVVVIGVSMLSTFDPAIGPLVPVLVSYWLNIHVTIITSSYGFLGLSALIGALVLILYMAKAPGRGEVKDAITTLDRVNQYVVVTGLGLLTIGTLLGGVWANESWGRYWGWDSKETWSLITILVYSVVLHFRFIPKMRSMWLNAATATAAIGSVVMTYFGVNYFLSGLHSYAQGDAAQVPNWVYIFTFVVLGMIALSGTIAVSRKWER